MDNKISRGAVESAYCIFHQKYRVYEYSDSPVQRDEIESAVASYAIGMNRDLYLALAGGREGFLMEHGRFASDLKSAIGSLEKMMQYGPSAAE